jgi:SSS family solute:Na+ symporter
VPSGIKGFIFAALIAAIVSSLAAIINSASTIFSLDIYKYYFKPDISEGSLVKTGKISSIVIIAIAAVIASFLTGIEQIFQFIQEYTGLVSPGITALFLWGIFNKRITSKAAWIAVLITIPVPLLLKVFFPAMPFLDNMVVSFAIISVQMFVVSYFDKNPVATISWDLPNGIFKNTDLIFKLLSVGIILILCLLYYIFW